MASDDFGSGCGIWLLFMSGCFIVVGMFGGCIDSSLDDESSSSSSSDKYYPPDVRGSEEQEFYDKYGMSYEDFEEFKEARDKALDDAKKMNQ